MITFSVQDILIWVLLAVAIIAVIMLIKVLASLGPTTKSLASVLEKLDKTMSDVNEITEQAKTGTIETKAAITSAAASMNDVLKTVRGHKGTIAAATNVINAMSNLSAIFRK